VLIEKGLTRQQKYDKEKEKNKIEFQQKYVENENFQSDVFNSNKKEE